MLLHFAAETYCKGEPPTPVPGSTFLPVSSGKQAKGSVALYACNNDPMVRLFAKCEEDGNWSRVFGECPEGDGGARIGGKTIANSSITFIDWHYSLRCQGAFARKPKIGRIRRRGRGGGSRKLLSAKASKLHDTGGTGARRRPGTRSGLKRRR